MKLELTEENIDAVAHQLLTAYRRKRQSKRPSYKPSARVLNMNNWKGAARQCIEVNAPPEKYVEAMFEGCDLSTGPFPNMMGGKQALRWWKEYKNKAGYSDSGTVVDTKIAELLVLKQTKENFRESVAKSTGRSLSYVAQRDYATDAVTAFLLDWNIPEVVLRKREELIHALEQDPLLRAALEKLKPGCVKELLS